MHFNEDFERIASCKVFKDKGLYYGKLRLKREVSCDLYFYYIELLTREGYHFKGLDFYENELIEKPAKKFKEMIV